MNLRVICATNRNLEEAVQRGGFRMDLFYRINMFVIEVPPLRERLSDISELAEHFLLTGSRCGKTVAQRISQAALSALCQHNWPGNVRELQNAIEAGLSRLRRMKKSTFPICRHRCSGALRSSRKRTAGIPKART